MVPVRLKVVYPEKLAVPPDRLNEFAVPVSPVKPESEAPEFNVKVPLVCVKVPVPDSVLLVVILRGIVGLFPNGNAQPVKVLVPVWPVRLTEEKVWVVHVIPAAPPKKLTVPPLLLKIPLLKSTPDPNSNKAGAVKVEAELVSTRLPPKCTRVMLPKLR